MVQRRIFGIENEYGVTCTLRGQRRLSPDEVARYLFRKVVSWGRSNNVFLANGSRLYLDVGSPTEYTTPERDSAHDLVVHVDARSLANAYAQSLGQVFTHELKPMEVAAVLDRANDRRAFRRLSDEEVAALLAG